MSDRRLPNWYLKEFKARLMNEPGNPDPATAWRAAHGEIGDDAFHRIEEELDWFEMVDGRREEL